MEKLSRQAIQRYKDMYPPGTGICVDNMPDDPRPISSGTKGKVIEQYFSKKEQEDICADIADNLPPLFM